jgi:hypothetical protein
MTKTRHELLEALEQVREATEAVLAEMSEELFLAPIEDGDWSAKDILAHITAWEVEMLTNLGKARRGLKSIKTDWSQAAIQAQNEKWLVQYRQRPLSSVLTDFDGVRNQTVRLISGLSDAEVAAPLKWWKNRPLADYVIEWAVDHEMEHQTVLRAWRAQQPGGVSADKHVSGNGSHAGI